MRQATARIEPEAGGSSLTERHYTPGELAELWNLSTDTVRRLFEREPGVLVIGDHGSGHRRRHLTLRIPESVAQRVHRRLSVVRDTRQ